MSRCKTCVYVVPSNWVVRPTYSELSLHCSAVVSLNALMQSGCAVMVSDFNVLLCVKWGLQLSYMMFCVCVCVFLLCFEGHRAWLTLCTTPVLLPRLKWVVRSAYCMLSLGLFVLCKVQPWQILCVHDCVVCLWTEVICNAEALSLIAIIVCMVGVFVYYQNLRHDW